MIKSKEQTDYEKSLRDCEDVWFKRYRLKCEEINNIKSDLIKKIKAFPIDKYKVDTGIHITEFKRLLIKELSDKKYPNQAERHLL